MDDEKIASCFAALGSGVRMSLFRALMDSSPSGLGPTTLSDLIGIPRNLVSYHLSPLRACGLVISEKSGRDVLYRISRKGLVEFAISVQALVMDRGENSKNAL